MSIPNVAIVGRPNVGKSSLLNAMAGRRVSIVEPTAGVTRDRVSFFVQWKDREFELVDTGGLGLVDEALLKKHVHSQIDVAMDQADLILFLFDTKDGLGPMDEQIAERLRKLEKPVLLCANKVESNRDELEAVEAWSLGMGEPHQVSAKEGYGVSDLMDLIVDTMPEWPIDEVKEEMGLKLAIVGKRNSGKSTLVNLLSGAERVIVSEMPGTTRDAVDVRFERDGKVWTAIDTAGVRKKSSVQDAIEFFSLARSERSIRRADIVFLMFDMSEEISQVDKKLAAFAIQNYKPCILLGNKLDLAAEAGKDPAAWEDYLREQLPGLSFAPISFISALADTNVEETLELAEDLYDQASYQTTTAALNSVMQRAKQMHSPSDKSARPKLFYATQVDNNPPTLLVFVNDPRYFTGQYDRYLQNQLRQAFPWKEVPIRIVYRRRQKVDLPPDSH